VPASLDHLIYACPDLDGAVDRLRDVTGVRAVPGGRHPRFGTRNAFLALGDDSTLEILGPDATPPDPPGPRLFGVDHLRAPRLLTWVAKGRDLVRVVSDARARGVPLGDVSSGSRTKPDGTLVTWEFSAPTALPCDGIVPFLIDWGDTPHPALGAARGCSIVALRAEHPDPGRARAMLETLGIDLRVDAGPRPALVATLLTPKGEVELR
jgi:hypothetical protein